MNNKSQLSNLKSLRGVDMSATKPLSPNEGESRSKNISHKRKWKMENGKWKSNFSIIDLLSLLFFLLFTTAGILVSLNRFWQYEVYYIDFGIFDQAIWKVAHFQPPIIEHFLVSGKWIFADHFSPSIFLLSPFYWITNRPEVILILQALIVGISGLVLYRIAKTLLKHDLLAFAILTCYFLFIGLQNAVITEFHELTIMTLPLMLMFWAIVEKKIKLYFLFLIITLGFKEIDFSTCIGVAIAMLFMRREWWKISIITIVISLIWGFLALKVVIPYFSNGLYIYSPSLPSSVLGKVQALVDVPLKRSTLLYSFWSFGFLPIFAPAFWPAILQDYSLRFLPQGFYTRWGLGLHYNAQSAVLLSVSSIYAIRFLKNHLSFQRKGRHHKVGSTRSETEGKSRSYKQPILIFLSIMLILNAFYLYRVKLHGPLALAYNPAFYKHTGDFNIINDLVARVPKNVTVMTQNDLASRFTHQIVWFLQSGYEGHKPDYIVVDNRKDQNPNDFFGTDTSPDLILSKLKYDPNYKLIYHTNEQFIYKRVGLTN